MPLKKTLLKKNHFAKEQRRRHGPKYDGQSSYSPASNSGLLASRCSRPGCILVSVFGKAIPTSKFRNINKTRLEQYFASEIHM